jgi:hypothetical protein
MRFVLVAIFTTASMQAETIDFGNVSAEILPTIVAAGNINDALYAIPRGGIADTVGGLILQRFDGTFICSGSLLPNGIDILTAADCVSDGSGNLNLFAGTATFFPNPSGTETIAFAGAQKFPAYVGNSFDGNDLAVIHLQSPVVGITGASLFTGTNEVGQTYNVVGFGATGSNGAGATGGAGTRHQGFNQFDGTLQSTLGLSSNVLLSDFDDGTAPHDGFGFFFGIPSLGLGLNEVSIAGGDSGGPAFIGNQIAGINAFGLRLAFVSGSTSDIDGVLNASFGEFNGFTRVAPYDSWILGPHEFRLAPEPVTWLVTGCALLGIVVLRRWVTAVEVGGFRSPGEHYFGHRCERIRECAIAGRRMAEEHGLRQRDAQSVGWHYEQGLYRRLGLKVKSFRRSQGIQEFIDSFLAK